MFRFEYIKFWLRWYWIPYKETNVFDIVYRWLCFEALWKWYFRPTPRAADGAYCDCPNDHPEAIDITHFCMACKRPRR